MSRIMRGRRSGTIIAFVSVGLLVLVAFVGASVDIGRLSMFKQRMQAGGDLAATGGASSCNITYDWDLWAQTASLYAANIPADPNATPPTPQFVCFVPGSSGGWSIGARYTIGADTVTVTHPYHDSWTDSQGYTSSDLVRVDVTKNVALLLLPAIGIQTATVTTRSVAVCMPGGPLLIFAHSTDPSVYALDWTSSSCEINGDCHSNTKVDMSGSWQDINGWIDYRNSYSLTGSHDTIDPGWRVGNVLPYPIWFNVSDFWPFDYYINGHMLNFNGSIPAGVYYVKGDVHINTTDVPLGPITIIAGGKIHVDGNNHDFTAARNNVLFMSTQPLDQPGGYSMAINAQGGTWNGIFFAPYGDINFTASDQLMYNGGILAEEIHLGGQDFTATGVLPPIPRYYSRLIE
jgi:hypothetical protein